MQYVKLLSRFAQIRDSISGMYHNLLDNALRPYADDEALSSRAAAVMNMATMGTGPALALLLLYGFYGVTAGIIQFTTLALLWPIWYFSLSGGVPIRLVSNAFLASTVIAFQTTIYFSNGLESPFFAWQILSPLGAILLVNWRDLIVWSSICLVCLISWYAFDLPSRDDLLIGSLINVRTTSYVLLFFMHFNSLWLLLSNRRRIFISREKLENEMEKNQQLIAEMVKGQVEERAKLYRELAGELGPMLLEIRMQQEKLLQNNQIPATDAPALKQSLQDIEEELERISRNLKSSDLEENGLYAAILNLCSHLENTMPIKVNVKLAPGAKIRLDARSMHIYRIVQEAFRNIARHAQASRVELMLRVEARQVVAMHIEDNGVGIDSSLARKSQPGQRIGQGLQNIADRVVLLNGHLSIDAPPGGGTRIRISLPDPVHQRLRLPLT